MTGVTRGLYWLMAILLVAQFSAALGEMLLGKKSGISSVTGPFHGDIGLTVLLLAFIRIAWTTRDDRNMAKSRFHRITERKRGPCRALQPDNPGAGLSAYDQGGGRAEVANCECWILTDVSGDVTDAGGKGEHQI